MVSDTVTIPRSEYERLKRQAAKSPFLKELEEEAKRDQPASVAAAPAAAPTEVKPADPAPPKPAEPPPATA